MNPMTVFCVAALALALAACGGGGDGMQAEMMDMDEMDQMEEMDQGPTPEEIAATTARAVTKERAIAAEAAQLAPGSSTSATMHGDAGLGGTNTETGAAVGTYDVTFERDSMATTVEVTDSAKTGDDDPKFVQMADLMDGRTMHVRDNGDGEEEVVVVFTDIEAPKPTPFAMVHELNTNPTDATPAVNQSLTIDGNNFRMISGVAEFPSAALQANVPFEEDAEFTGMFAGAPGTYTCTNDECALSTDADGALSEIRGTWHFTPAESATVDVADDDYLHYGFWLKRTTVMGAVTYNEVETFAGSSIAASGGVTNVEDTATYEGGAVGVYVIKTLFDPNTGELIRASSGHFKADASLMARFGGDNIAVRRQNQIEGTIDNFVLSGEEENSWSVALQGVIAVGDGTATGTASGGVEGKDGSFRATFHGPTTDGTDPIQPHSVVGEFNADFVNGAVAGGFGARKTEE